MRERDGLRDDIGLWELSIPPLLGKITEDAIGRLLRGGWVRLKKEKKKKAAVNVMQILV